MSAIKTELMSVKNFIKIMDNPLQRDTPSHAAKAKKLHLKSYHPSHAKVSIAKNGSQLWKLDGHTRAFLWQSGELLAPDMLSADTYPVKDKAEAIELYKHFDNQNAVETVSDKISGVVKLMGIKNTKISFLRNIGIRNAIATLQTAQGGYNVRTEIDTLLKPYKKELAALLTQGWDHAFVKKTSKIKRPGFPSPATAAFLVTYRLYGADCLGFWDSYVEGHPMVNLKAGRDGATAAADYIKQQRAENMLMGRQNVAIHTEALINCYLKYRAKKPVKKFSEIYKFNIKQSKNQQLGALLKDLGYKR